MLSVLFTDSNVLLCDFHREKAWGEWASKTDNGVTQIRDTVLSLLRAVANAPSIAECDDAIAKLRKSFIWQSNARLQKWFENTWLPEKKVSLDRAIN